MSRCVEKSFAPCWQCGYGTGRAGFLLREGGISVGANRMPLPRNRKSAQPVP